LQPVYISTRILLVARAPFPWNRPAPLSLSGWSGPPVHCLPPPAPNSATVVPCPHATLLNAWSRAATRLLYFPSPSWPTRFLSPSSGRPSHCHPSGRAACHRRPPSRTWVELNRSDASRLHSPALARRLINSPP
jgi:hypothetical protein